jgi:O-antigen ligase
MTAILKELFPKRDNDANRISYYHLALLLISLPYDRFYSHLVLISLILHTLINLKKGDIKPLLTFCNLAVSSVFFLTLAGTLYSTNKPGAFNEWGKQVTILLLPLVLCLNPIDLKRYRSNLMLIFTISSAGTILFLYLQAIRTIRFYHFPLAALFSWDFTNHNFSGPLEIHATFFSMQIAIALIYAVSRLIKVTAVPQRVRYTILCLILSTGIIQLGSKSVFIGLLVIINLAVPYFLLNNRQQFKYVAVSLSLSALVITGIYHIDNFKQRFVTDLKKDLSKATADELFDPRLARWGVALKLAVKSPVIGHGSGTEIPLLKERFFEHKFYRSYLAGLNSHNQFISFLIKTGLIGLLVYLGTLYLGFRESIRQHDVLLFAFMIIITAVSFSENLLDVDKGIFFYSAFFSLFLYSGNTGNISAKQPEDA